MNRVHQSDVSCGAHLHNYYEPFPYEAFDHENIYGMTFVVHINHALRRFSESRH